MTRAVLFDVNHTVMGIRDELQSQSAAIDVLFGSVCEIKGATLDRKEFRETFNRAWSEGKRASFDKYEETRYEDIVVWILGQYDIQLNPVQLERVLQTYMAPLYDNAYVMDGMLDLIRDISKLARVGVITNYKYASGMRGFLKKVGISELLDCIVISSEVGWKKPDERIYLEAVSALKVESSDVVLVGNELEKDLWRARALGMSVVLYETEEHLDHDREFAELLRSRLDFSGFELTGTATSPSELRALLGDLLKG